MLFVTGNLLIRTTWQASYWFCWPVKQTTFQPTVSGAPALCQLTRVKKGKRWLNGPNLISLCQIFPYFTLAQLPQLIRHSHGNAWSARIVFSIPLLNLYWGVYPHPNPYPNPISSSLKKRGTIICIWVQSSLFQFLTSFLPFWIPFYFRVRAFSIPAVPCHVPIRSFPSPSRSIGFGDPKRFGRAE